MILLANQGDSLGQPKRSLRAATAVRYNYYVQQVAIKAGLDARTKFKILEYLLRGGGSWSYTKLYSLYELWCPPRVRVIHTPNFALSLAKLVCRASRKEYGT